MSDTSLATPRVSIIIPVPYWDWRARQCLRAVLDSLPVSVEAEILLVAEPSMVPAAALAAFGGGVGRVPTDPPSRLPVAANDGAARAQGEQLVFLPSDAEPQPGWLDELLAMAKAHPELAVIGSRVLALDDTVENAGFLISQQRAPIVRYRGFPADHPAVNRSCRLVAVSATGMLIHREAFARISGFDTVYEEILYDADLCLRLGKLGEQIWFCPSSTLYRFAINTPSEAMHSRDQQICRDRWEHQVHPDDVGHYLADNLIEVVYKDAYPAHIRVSPLVALPDPERGSEETAALLERRAIDARALLQEHTRIVMMQGDLLTCAFQSPIDTLAQMKLAAFFASGQRLSFQTETRPRVSIVIPLHNQAHLTYLTLETLRSTPVSTPYEIILVDDASTDATPSLLNRFDNVCVRTHEANQGFGESCNDGIALARGEFVCLLNSDIVATPGWLDALVGLMEARPECGAVGAKLISPDGTLQEAGSILWSDGSAHGYGRGENPDAAEYSYARTVDYCSAACLLVRKETLDRVGGFNSRFSPAYYEDVDLCLRIWATGQTVWYMPLATLFHMEHASSGRQRAVALQLRNRAILKEVWPQLAEQQAAPGSDLLRWRDRRSGARVLVIDDLVPLLQMGSGFPRTVALLEALADTGYVVTYLPATDPTPHQPMTRHLQACGIEVMHSRSDVTEWIESRRDYYDVAIISRPHNSSLIPRIRAANRNIKIIYDAEALFSLREANQARAEGDLISDGELAQRVRRELELVGAADLVFAVSNLERAAIARYHPQINTAVWGHAVPVRDHVPDFNSRGALGFLGYLASMPNNAAALYLVEKILPLVGTHCSIPVLIAGSGASEEVLHAVHRCPVPVKLTGFIEDLSAFYDQCRVFIAPHRFAAGIPLKVIEAMANGVPCVVSKLLADQLGLTDEVEALIGEDAVEFATQIMRLYKDKELWSRIQQHGYRFVRDHHDPRRMRDVLRSEIAALLESPMSGGPSLVVDIER